VISRRVRIQLAVFALVAVVGVVFAGGRYAGLGKYVPGYDPGYLVSADFIDSGGIFQGSEVTYRGVPVGKVEKLVLDSGSTGVTLKLRLKPGSKVPSTKLHASVANRSAIGEQYVNLEPCYQTTSEQAAGCRQGPFLRAGSSISRANTEIPIPPVQLIVNLDDLVRSVNRDDVTVVLDELGAAFDGVGDDLQRLIDASDQLTATATRYLPQTTKLIADSLPVLDTQRRTASDFKSYNADLAQLTAQLRASDPDFRKLFATGTDSAKAATTLLQANQANLPPLLSNLVFTAQVQAVRIPAIRQIIVTYPNVVAGGFTVTPGDGTAHFGFVTANSPGVCPGNDPGYLTKERDYADVAPKTANMNAHCSTTSGTTVRGADHAPRAEGLKPFPADRSQSINQPSSQRSLWDDLTSGLTTSTADYDPATGHAITANGVTYTLSSAAGAQQVFGDQSWQWLLLNPIRS
jgi:phospholipid/cholesterol/gamma-HCH transport system substrate-binding protein